MAAAAVVVGGAAASVVTPGLVFTRGVGVGSTSAQSATIINSGSWSVQVGTASITGTDAEDFSISRDTCSGTTLPIYAQCTITIRFSPVAVGDRSATLSITSNEPTSPLEIPISGTGVTAAPAATPLMVTVSGSQKLGSTTPTFRYSTSPSGVTVSSLSCTAVGTSTVIGAALPARKYTILGSSCTGSASGYAVTFRGAVDGFTVGAAKPAKR